MKCSERESLHRNWIKILLRCVFRVGELKKTFRKIFCKLCFHSVVDGTKCGTRTVLFDVRRFSEKLRKERFSVSYMCDMLPENLLQWRDAVSLFSGDFFICNMLAQFQGYLLGTICLQRMFKTRSKKFQRCLYYSNYWTYRKLLKWIITLN